jgi:hypothetical protein
MSKITNVRPSSGSSTARKVVLAATFVVLGFGGVSLYGYSVGWWADRENERISELLRTSNPQFKENMEVIEKAVAQAVTSPSFESAKESLPQRTAVPVPAEDGQVPAGDSQWAEYERTSFRLAESVTRDDLLDVAGLFRNKRLNPTDDYIPPSRRSVLEHWLAAKRPVLRHLKNAAHEVSSQELNFMIDRGEARFIEYSTFNDSKSPEEKAETDKRLAELRKTLEDLGASKTQIEASLKDTKIFNDRDVCEGTFCHATRGGDSRIYLGDLARMPQTTFAAQAYYATAMEVYSGIVQFFRENVSLPAASETEIMIAVNAAMDRYLVE